MDLLRIESSWHVAAVVVWLTAAGLNHVAEMSELLDDVLKLWFVRGESAAEQRQDLPHGMLVEASTNHQEECPLARPDCHAIERGDAVAHDSVAGYVCIHCFARPHAKRVHLHELSGCFLIVEMCNVGIE